MKIRLGDFGMVLVLLGLVALFSVLTLQKRSDQGPAAVAEIVEAVNKRVDPDATVVAVGATNTISADLAESVAARLEEGGRANVRLVVGSARDLRVALDELKTAGGKLGAIATTGDAAKWRVFDQLETNYPEFAGYEKLTPGEGIWPVFLTGANLLAVVERIVVIAIIAIGMTMVIITAGIDLSVGSLVALSAVVGASVIQALGGKEASSGVVFLGFLAGTAACGGIGLLAGGIIARFKVAPFIVTLGIMMMVRGLARITTGGFTINAVPDSYGWLAHGSILGIPTTIVLLVVMYSAAHVFMEKTKAGRYIYAVGGNTEAARLSGVPVGFVIVMVYTVGGLMAGLGGCIEASQVRAAAPTMGVTMELSVIAAVVVGGTSLFGGSGRILGTLIGAFIIAVMQNGMNCLGITSAMQQIVLGGVIILAVLLDKARQVGGIRPLLAGA